MFYCVYFFSPFGLKPVLVRLLSQGWMAHGKSLTSWKEGDTQCTLLHPVLSFIWNVLCPWPTSSFFPRSRFLLDFQNLTQMSFLAKHLLPFLSGPGYLPSLFIPLSCGSCFGGLWVVMCMTIVFPWELLESGDHVIFISDH